MTVRLTTRPPFDFAEFVEVFCTGYIACRDGLIDADGEAYMRGLMAAYQSSGCQRARRLTRELSNTISDAMVERAAAAMHEAYVPDEGDDPEQCWRGAMYAALFAALAPGSSHGGVS